jgi:hypothetical protein
LFLCRVLWLLPSELPLTFCLFFLMQTKYTWTHEGSLRLYFSEIRSLMSLHKALNCCMHSWFRGFPFHLPNRFCWGSPHYISLHTKPGYFEA